jgi:hypothetical protein
MPMALFTFILEYRGGTYASQVRAPSLRRAAAAWAAGLDTNSIRGAGPAARRQLREEISADEPVALAGLTGVWCYTALVRGHLALINVVETRG